MGICSGWTPAAPTLLPLWHPGHLRGSRRNKQQSRVALGWSLSNNASFPSQYLPLFLESPKLSHLLSQAAVLIAARLWMQLWSPMPGTKGISTTQSPSAGISQTAPAQCQEPTPGTRCPTQQDHRKSQGNNDKAWKHQLTTPRIQERPEGSSWDSGIEERKVTPCHTPTHVVFCICITEGNSGAGEQSRWPAEDDGQDFHPAALPTSHRSCTWERTDPDGQCSGHSGNAKTDGPLLDSSSSNSLWEEEGAMLRVPKSAHS